MNVERLFVLEASFIIMRLQSYFENITKKFVKTPKLFFVETKLVAYLLGIETITQMQRDPLRGHLFENMIVMELIKARLNKGLDLHLYFYRDQQKHEVDVIYKVSSQLIPIEIKSSKTFHRDFLKELDYFSKVFPEKCEKGYVIYTEDQTQKMGWKMLLNFIESKEIIIQAN